MFSRILHIAFVLLQSSRHNKLSTGDVSPMISKHFQKRRSSARKKTPPPSPSAAAFEKAWLCPLPSGGRTASDPCEASPCRWGKATAPWEPVFSAERERPTPRRTIVVRTQTGQVRNQNTKSAYSIVCTCQRVHGQMSDVLYAVNGHFGLVYQHVRLSVWTCLVRLRHPR